MMARLVSDPCTRDDARLDQTLCTQDEGQAGSDPGTRDEGQAGPNPDDINIAESLPLPTPSVLAGPNLEHSDVEITGPSSQPQPEHMDEGFGDQFLNDKPSEADNEKTTADTEAESMVSVTIQQDTSITPPMTSPVIDLVSRPDSPNVHWPLPTTTTTTAAPPPTTTTTTTLPLPPQLQQGSSESLLIKRMGELEQHIADRVEENQALESRLEKQGSRIRKLETMDWTNMIREQTTKFIESYEIDRKIEESVKEVQMKTTGLNPSDEDEDFDVDKAQEETQRRKERARLLQSHPPGSPPSSHHLPPPPSAGVIRTSGTTELLILPKLLLTRTSIFQSIVRKIYFLTILYGLRKTTCDVQALSSDDETIPSSDLFHKPTNNLGLCSESTYAPPQRTTLLASSKPTGIWGHLWTGSVNNEESLKLLPRTWKSATNFKPDQVDDAILRYNFSKPVPWDVRKVGRPALTISKDEGGHFNPECRLSNNVRDQIWIERNAIKNIAGYAWYLSLGGLKTTFYIDRFSSEETWLSDTAYKTLPAGIKSYQTQLKPHKPRWKATGFRIQHDYTARFLQGQYNVSHDPARSREGILPREKPLVLVRIGVYPHRSVLTDQEDQAKMEMETPRSSRVNSPPNAHS
ncbi:hypothetical protein Tco_0103884 [Tanacetum coccineum]